MDPVLAWVFVIGAMLTMWGIGVLIGAGLERSEWRPKPGTCYRDVSTLGGRYIVLPLERFKDDYVYKGCVLSGLYVPTDEEMERYGVAKPVALSIHEDVDITTEDIMLPGESLFAAKVREELASARSHHEPLNSLHEAYAVIMEEIEEFWAEVMKKRDERRPERLLEELVQIGAMVERTASDLGYDRQLVRPLGEAA